MSTYTITQYDQINNSVTFDLELELENPTLILQEDGTHAETTSFVVEKKIDWSNWENPSELQDELNKYLTNYEDNFKLTQPTVEPKQAELPADFLDLIGKKLSNTIAYSNEETTDQNQEVTNIEVTQY
jgi:hypothetical protein